MIRCSIHGLALAPDGKCVRCRRAEAHALGMGPGARAPSSRGEPVRLPVARGRVVAVLLALLAASVAVSVLAWRRDHPGGDGATKALVSESPLPQPMPSALAPLAPLIQAAAPAAEPSVRRAPDGDRAAARLEAATHRVPITVYGAAWDPGSARAEAWLRGRGYAFTSRDVDKDAAAARARAALTTSRVLPVLDVDGQVLVGFDAERTGRALEYAAARQMER